MFLKMVILMLLLIPFSVAAMPVDTVIEVDLYGAAKVQHTLSASYKRITLKVYNPESLDIGSNSKFSLKDDKLILNDIKAGTKIIYISKSLSKKDGDWLINYDPFQNQSLKIILPVSSKIKYSSGDSLQSKEKIGQIIEWDKINNAKLRYMVQDIKQFNYELAFYIALIIAFIFLGICIILIKKPLKGHQLFLERFKGIKRPIIKRVIFAILVLHEQGDRLIDQSKIRAVLRKEGFKKINNHKGEINKAVKDEINWFIERIDSKIKVRKRAVKKYELALNVKNLIKAIRNDDLIEKGDDYGK